MASINRSADSSDRRGSTGKGDLPRRGSDVPFRENKAFWGKSPCCGAGILRIGGDLSHLVCEKCRHSIRP